MFSRCILRSVRRRTRLASGTSGATTSRRGGNIVLTMWDSFEERMFFPAQHRTFASSAEHESRRCKDKIPDATIDAQYKEAIVALNQLQSNAESIRRSIINNRQIPLDDTYTYLERSGLTMADVDKLSFIHVAGSKGKGSTCALTDSILRAHGIRTGFFSSPHLVSVTERIRINGEPISKQDFTRHFWPIFRRMDALKQDERDMPAYFKFLMILCFHVFLEQRVDVVIFEVGIGGELDCTNVIRNTGTVGITSLGLEHTQLLGDTLAEIAWQKAGIIKENSNVYTSATQPECLQVIQERALEKKASFHVVPDFSQYVESNGEYRHLLNELNNIAKLNGSLAIQLAYDWMRSHKNGLHRQYALNATQLNEKVVQSLVNCNWPGRCQVVRYINFNIHLDGAHTLESIAICCDWFDRVTEKSSNPKALVFNTTGDRDSKQLLEMLRQGNRFRVACFVPNISSSASSRGDNHSLLLEMEEQMKRPKLHGGNWQELCAESGVQDSSNIFSSIKESFEYLHRHFGPAQEVDVLVTGSLHLIGATVLALNEFKGTPPT